MHAGQKRKTTDATDASAAKDVDAGSAKNRKTESEVQLKGLVGTGLAMSGPHHRTNAEFLAALIYTRAEQLRVPDNKVFIAERTDKVVDVFKGLVRHNFLSVPVLQKTKHKWFGFLDLADIVLYVVNTFGESKLNVDEDFWTLVEREEEFQHKTVNDLMRFPLTRRNPFNPVKGGYSLLYAIEALARERSLHRVPVVDDERKLMNLITQSQVVRFLQQNMHLLGDKRSTPVNEIHGVMHDVYCINMHQRAIDAFHQMVDKEVTGVAIVDDTGKLRGNLSLRDLKAMSTDGRFFWRLYQTVDNYLTKLKRETKEGGRPKRVQTCKATHTLEHAINLLADHSIHRVFVVDDAKKPIGVITLKDVLVELLSP
jgi:5'-AMP-activated protein kinase regulatory gamma subunit